VDGPLFPRIKEIRTPHFNWASVDGSQFAFSSFVSPATTRFELSLPCDPLDSSFVSGYLEGIGFHALKPESLKLEVRSSDLDNPSLPDLSGSLLSILPSLGQLHTLELCPRMVTFKLLDVVGSINSLRKLKIAGTWIWQGVLILPTREPNNSSSNEKFRDLLSLSVKTNALSLKSFFKEYLFNATSSIEELDCTFVEPPGTGDQLDFIGTQLRKTLKLLIIRINKSDWVINQSPRRDVMDDRILPSGYLSGASQYENLVELRIYRPMYPNIYIQEMAMGTSWHNLRHLTTGYLEKSYDFGLSIEDLVKYSGPGMDISFLGLLRQNTPNLVTTEPALFACDTSS